MRQHLIVLLVILVIAAVASSVVAIWWARSAVATRRLVIDSERQNVQDLQVRCDETDAKLRTKVKEAEDLRAERDRLRDELASDLLGTARDAKERGDIVRSEAIAKKAAEFHKTPEIQAFLEETHKTVISLQRAQDEASKLVAQAQVFERTLNWSAAIPKLQDAYKVLPTEALRKHIISDQASELAEEAEALEKAGKADEARQIWNKAIQLDPRRGKTRPDRWSIVGVLSEAGQEAMDGRGWRGAIGIYTYLIGILDEANPVEAALKRDAESQIALATRQLEVETKRP
jgi:tetratricopeptide (TPR) repeat protein